MIGIIGLGRIGATVADALLAEGQDVVGHRRGPTAEFERAGGIAVGSPREVLERSELVLLALPTVDALRTVTWGKYGLVSAKPSPGVVVADLSTIGVADKLAVREALTSIGVGMLDCPVSGMPVPGRRPPLVTMFASGDDDDLERCDATLRSLVSDLRHVGAFGSGTTLKLVANALVTLHTVAAAEALALGSRAGLDAEVMIEILTASPATSWVLEDRGARMVRGEHQPARASVDLLLKDLGLIQDLALATGTPLPNLEAAVRTFEAARERGWGQDDVTVVHRLAAEPSGTTGGGHDVR